LRYYRYRIPLARRNETHMAGRKESGRGPGRPALPKGEKKRHVVPFKVDDTELRELNRKARELGLSRSEVIRLAVKKLLGKG